MGLDSHSMAEFMLGIDIEGGSVLIKCDVRIRIPVFLKKGRTDEIVVLVRFVGSSFFNVDSVTRSGCSTCGGSGRHGKIVGDL